MCMDYRKTANSNNFACITQGTQQMHRTSNTRLSFLAIIVFFPLILVDGVTIILYDIDMVFY